MTEEAERILWEDSLTFPRAPMGRAGRFGMRRRMARGKVRNEGWKAILSPRYDTAGWGIAKEPTAKAVGSFWLLLWYENQFDCY